MISRTIKVLRFKIIYILIQKVILQSIISKIIIFFFPIIFISLSHFPINFLFIYFKIQSSLEGFYDQQMNPMRATRQSQPNEPPPAFKLFPTTSDKLSQTRANSNNNHTRTRPMPSLPRTKPEVQFRPTCNGPRDQIRSNLIGLENSLLANSYLVYTFIPPKFSLHRLIEACIFHRK